MLHGIRWILFDAVGTLIYPDPPVADVYFTAAHEFGSRLAISEICERFAAALCDSYSECSETNDVHERQRWKSIVGRVIDDVPHREEQLFEHLWNHFAQPKHWRLYDDVASSLSELRCRGFKLGIASNFDVRLKAIAAAHAPLAACDRIFVSTEVGYSKPDPRFFREVQQRLGITASEIALVGDDEISDVQGATAAGWRAIWLDRQAPRDGVIHSLAELLE